MFTDPVASITSATIFPIGDVNQLVANCGSGERWGGGRDQIAVVEEGLGGESSKKGVPEDNKAEDNLHVEVVGYYGPDPAMLGRTDLYSDLQHCLLLWDA